MKNLEWQEVEGFTYPELIDDTSSSIYTYVRRNVKETRNKSYTGKDAKGTHWSYEEAKLTKEEFNEYSVSEPLKILLDMASRISSMESELKKMKNLLLKLEK